MDKQLWFPFADSPYVRMMCLPLPKIFFMDFRYSPEDPDCPGQLTFGWD